MVFHHFRTPPPPHPALTLLLAVQEVGLLGDKGMDFGARNPSSLLASCFEML